MRITLLIFCITLLMSCESKKKDYEPLKKKIAQNEVVVKEVQQTSGYTYLLVQESDKEYWMAVGKTETEIQEFFENTVPYSFFPELISAI